VAVLGIGEPRRHFLRDHGGLHGLGPRARVRISQERHRRDFAGTMALLAVLLQDGKNVLIKRDRGVRSGESSRSHQATKDRNLDDSHNPCLLGQCYNGTFIIAKDIVGSKGWLSLSYGERRSTQDLEIDLLRSSSVTPSRPRMACWIGAI